MTLADAAVPVVRALVDEARRKGYRGGVLGVRARPSWEGPDEFEHEGAPVRVVACPSALAVREVLPARAEGRWLVVLTDRDEDDLGLGIMAHLLWHRLRTPDPWEAVRQRFAATGIDHRLVADPKVSRELAVGLLAATPPEGWPAAPSGPLTREHAMESVARRRLGVGPRGESIDARSVLAWTADPGAATAVADLRADGGNTLADATVDWLGERAGAASAAVLPLLRAGRIADALPLGLVADVIAGAPADSGPRALLESPQGVGAAMRTPLLRAWAQESRAVVDDLLASDRTAATRVLSRADALATALRAEGLVEASTVLPSGLAARLGRLGGALREATPDGVPTTEDRLAAVESAWAAVDEHVLAADESVRVGRAQAAVRLVRWLAAPPAEPVSGLGAGVEWYRDEGGWVDRAYADVWAGVSDEGLSLGLKSVALAVRVRRRVQDRAFAAALASEAGRGPAGAAWLPIERVVGEVVVPLARQVPTLLLVLDGMSVAAGTEIADHVTRRVADGWLEALPAGRVRRIASVSALPTITEVSRASLLCGELTTGQQKVEVDGFAALLRAHGLTGRLAHKALLDASAAGFELSPDLMTAVDDVRGQTLVAAVLNTIDDALDRSDPGGTDWTADAVKHLRPLLDRARRAGRAVVLTSDHGHIVERREGKQVGGLETLGSNRSRVDSGTGAGEGEVLVEGPRVLTADHRAVLAVDETLRYGPLKAGYHGGAAPAEAVVPVVVLVPGSAPDGWALVPVQAPGWWVGAASGSAVVPAPAVAVAPSATPTLFDEVVPEPPAPSSTAGLAEAVLASPVYAQQRARAARLSLDDVQVAGLLRALLAAQDHRVGRTAAAAALGVNEVLLSGAISQVRRLLNVEQYGVIGFDADGVTVVLDRALLVEQFGVAG